TKHGRTRKAHLAHDGVHVGGVVGLRRVLFDASAAVGKLGCVAAPAPLWRLGWHLGRRGFNYRVGSFIIVAVSHARLLFSRVGGHKRRAMPLVPVLLQY